METAGLAGQAVKGKVVERVETVELERRAGRVAMLVTVVLVDRVEWVVAVEMAVLAAVGKVVEPEVTGDTEVLVLLVGKVDRADQVAQVRPAALVDSEARARPAFLPAYPDPMVLMAQVTTLARISRRCFGV